MNIGSGLKINDSDGVSFQFVPLTSFYVFSYEEPLSPKPAKENRPIQYKG